MLLITLCGAVGYMGYSVWSDSQTVFRNVTVELGAETLSIRDFMTDQAKEKRVSFVSDPSTVDLSKVGVTALTLKHGTQTYTVTLTVQDTLKPEAVIEQEHTVSIAEGFPEARELVQEVKDASDVRIYYAQEPWIPEDYSDSNITVVVEDVCGNKLEQSCRFHYYGWLKESCTLELGASLTPEMLLTDPERDGDLLDPVQLAEIAGSTGEHVLTVSTGNTQESCTVLVEDTTGPELELQNVRRYPGETVELEDFIVYTSDLSGEPQVRMVSEEPDCSVQTTYTVTIEAEDAWGNVTTADAILWVSKNMSPPEIKGASEPISMEKYSTVDFLEGVTAKDDIDGKCEVTVDTSSLDTSTAGTYYITYSSIDSSGNVGTYKRKVVVEPNEEDTAALVKELADSLPDDPELIRDYVRDNIAYGSSWGGDDPVWYGFTNNTGNCFVHANCLKALLDYKGYETQLIWVTNKSHYWLIIKLDIGWRHIDSTPSYQHRKISLMTDAERYQNLNGRNWDRSLWPACE
ncbi:MAG: immunoglobulin-like domain-containing protein [Oscillospiraceae bacterium]